MGAGADHPSCQRGLHAARASCCSPAVRSVPLRCPRRVAERLADQVEHRQCSGPRRPRPAPRPPRRWCRRPPRARGSASSATVTSKTIGHGVEVLVATRRRRAARSGRRGRRASSPTVPSTPHSSRSSRRTALRGGSPWSMPPPGSVHAAGVRAALRVAGQEHPCRHAGPARRPPTRCVPERAGGRPAPRHHGRHRHGAVQHVGDRVPRRVHRRPVDLDDLRLRGVRRDPAVVDDAQGVGVDAPTVSPDLGQMGRVQPRGLTDDRVEAGLLVDLAHHRVARVLAVVEPTTGQRPELLGRDARARRLSRIMSSRRITAYAATR